MERGNDVHDRRGRYGANSALDSRYLAGVLRHLIPAASIVTTEGRCAPVSIPVIFTIRYVADHKQKSTRGATFLVDYRLVAAIKNKK